jgi:hypothetical protein
LLACFFILFLLLTITSFTNADETRESISVNNYLDSTSIDDTNLMVTNSLDKAAMEPISGLTYGSDVYDFWKPFWEDKNGNGADVPEIITANNTYKGRITKQTTDIYIKGAVGSVRDAAGSYFDQKSSQFYIEEGGGTKSPSKVKYVDFTMSNQDFSKVSGSSVTLMWQTKAYGYARLMNIPFFVSKTPDMEVPTNLSKTLSGTGEPLFNFTITVSRNGQDIELAKGTFDANGEFKKIPIKTGLPLKEKEILTIESYDPYNLEIKSSTVEVIHEALPTSPTIKGPLFPTALTSSKTINGMGTFPGDEVSYKIYNSNGTSIDEQGSTVIQSDKRWSVDLGKDLLPFQKVEVAELDPYDNAVTGIVSTIVADKPAPMLKFISVKPLEFETKSLDDTEPDGYLLSSRVKDWGLSILDSRNGGVGGNWSVMVELKDSKLVSTLDPSHTLFTPLVLKFDTYDVPIQSRLAVLSSSNSTPTGSITESVKGQKFFTYDLSFKSEDVGMYLKTSVDKVYPENYSGVLEYTLTDLPSR